MPDRPVHRLLASLRPPRLRHLFPSLLRALARRWYLGLLAALGLVLATPSVMLVQGTQRARACVASYEAPRGPALPDCVQEVRWLILPSRIPWTATPARYRAEELVVRAAVAAYDDATVGRPDEASQRRAGEALQAAQGTIRRGSQRLALEELGRAVGAPDPGRSAMLAGDRRTLLRPGDVWQHWSIQLRALEAALLEGDLAVTRALARTYADFDPRDQDLRIAVATMLCLFGEPERGAGMLLLVQNDRARDRHESWARNWGDVRAAIVACSAKAGAPPPPLPDHTGGGEGDMREARAALRLRILQGRPADTEGRQTAALDAIKMLKAGPLPPGARVRVLASLLATSETPRSSDTAATATPSPLDASLLAELARPRVDDEPPLLPPARALTALDWLGEPRGLRPSPSREALRAAADVLREKAGSPDASAEDRLALETASAAVAIEASKDLARAGDGEGALAVLERAGERALPSAAARALARSSAWYVAGDPARALAEVEREPPDLAHEAALRAVWWLQKAELLASTGRHDEAARAAVLADEEAAVLGDRGLEVRALWTRLALARPPLPPLRGEPPPLLAERSWPWVGEIATPFSWLDPAAESPEALARALGFWDAARRASPDERRAIRYAAFASHRGDAPAAFPAYLALAAELLHPDEGDVEVWLDAFAATSSRRLTLRAYAWSRTEAARFRGDAAAAGRWAARYRTLATLAARPGDAELAALLGI